MASPINRNVNSNTPANQTSFDGFIRRKNYQTETKPSGPLKKVIKAILKEAEQTSPSSEKRSFKILELGSGGAKGVYQIAKSQLKDKFNVEITAVEKDPLGAEYAQKVSEEEDIKGKIKIRSVNQGIEEFLATNKEEYDLIVASYSLFYVKDFDKTLDKVLSTVKDEGHFCGHFLGDKDEWNGQDLEVSLHFIKKEEMQKTFKEHSFKFIGYQNKDVVPFEIPAREVAPGMILPKVEGTKSNEDGFKERYKKGARGAKLDITTMHSFHVVAKKTKV